jgi:hypothetical protein
VYFNFTAKINSPNRKKNDNIDDKRVMNTNRVWICQKINFQLKVFATVTMTILKKMASRRKNEGEIHWIYGIIYINYAGLSLKFCPR